MLGQVPDIQYLCQVSKRITGPGVKHSPNPEEPVPDLEFTAPDQDLRKIIRIQNTDKKIYRFKTEHFGGKI